MTQSTDAHTKVLPVRSLKIMNGNQQTEKDEPERFKAEKAVNVSVN